MSKDLDPYTPRPEDDGKMVIVATEEQYWLLEGEEHISSMLAGRDEHPTPVICLTFASVFELQTFLPEGVALQALWAINPLIIERMRASGELEERGDPGQ